jgi:DNA-binding response OmpR family regulator
MKEKINILIIDDLELAHEPITRFLIDFVFLENELNITSVYNLTQAKRSLNERKYNLVMLDGDVGGSWGYEIIQKIFENNNKTIIISSSNHDEFNIKNVNLGAHESVNKTYLYDWNDEKGVLRTQKAKVITELVKRNLNK